MEEKAQQDDLKQQAGAQTTQNGNQTAPECVIVEEQADKEGEQGPMKPSQAVTNQESGQQKGTPNAAGVQDSEEKAFQPNPKKMTEEQKEDKSDTQDTQNPEKAKTSKPSVSKNIKVYELRCSIYKSDPEIYRVVQVWSNMKLSELHVVLQTAFGWGNRRLHEFKKSYDSKESYGVIIKDQVGLRDLQDDRKFRLHDFFKVCGDKLYYEYDLFSTWAHNIQLTQITQYKKQPLPAVIDGQMASPPECCAGIEAYKDMLGILNNAGHAEHQKVRNQMDSASSHKPFDPNYFSKELVSEQFQKWNGIVPVKDFKKQQYQNQKIRPGQASNIPLNMNFMSYFK